MEGKPHGLGYRSRVITKQREGSIWPNKTMALASRLWGRRSHTVYALCERHEGRFTQVDQTA